MKRWPVLIYLILTVLSAVATFNLVTGTNSSGLEGVIVIVPLIVGSTISLVFLGLLITNIFLKERAIDNVNTSTPVGKMIAVLVGGGCLFINFFLKIGTLESLFVKPFLFTLGIALIITGLPKTVDWLVRKLKS
jgi:hypothetical protein